MIQVIVNADDFGYSRGVNSAIIRAYKQGVLTSASLMVNAEATEEAVTLAQANPGLAIGLHLVLVGGCATLPHKVIPHLVDRDGCFSSSPLSFGLNLVFNQKARAELAQEMEAQFDRFVASDLPLSHVDSHMHIHIHPAVLKLTITLAQQYGAKGVRLPNDDLYQALRFDRRRVFQKVGWAIIFGIFQRLYLPKLRKTNLAVPSRVYGLMQSGQMQEDYVVEVLRNLQAETAELYFHPDIASAGQSLGPNSGDLATLVSPSVRSVIEQRNIHLTNYANLNSQH